MWLERVGELGEHKALRQRSEPRRVTNSSADAGGSIRATGEGPHLRFPFVPSLVHPAFGMPERLDTWRRSEQETRRALGRVQERPFEMRTSKRCCVRHYRDECPVAITETCTNDQRWPDLLNHPKIEKPDLTANGRHSPPRQASRRDYRLHAPSLDRRAGRNQRESSCGGIRR